MMGALFASGHVVDAILVLVVIEAAIVMTYRHRTGRGPAPAAFLANLLAGAFLLTALRVALVGGWWGWIGAFLAAGGLAHAVDLRRRWSDPNDGADPGHRSPGA